MASLSDNPPKRATTVKFARKTSSGRYVSLSREDMDYMSYNVQMPPTPDNQLMEYEVQNEPLYGGIPRPRMINNIVESEASRLQKIAARGSACAMPDCEQTVMQDGHGYDIHPCECRFKICQNCYLDAQKEGGTCPSCKEPYKTDDYGNGNRNVSVEAITKTATWVENNRISVMKRSETVDSDQSWLFEIQGTYGYDTAFWPKEGTDNAKNITNEELEDGTPGTSDKIWKPLTRNIPMSAAIISPYRILIVIRFVALIFFLTWRVKHPNEDAIWLWGMSVVCEIWFAFSWILDQVPKLSPINRSTDLSVLQEKFETPSLSNKTTLSDLPGVDVFVSTADPEKEPPLVTANTILSILAADYPVEKLACYISDDGGALLTFEAIAEAASFAATWVPFCRKHGIEPRNPESYFGLKRDPTKNKMRSDFVKDRRKVKREYDEFKVRVNGLPDSIRRRSDAFNAREEMKILRKMRESGGELEPIKACKATWMADGTYWPGTWIVPGPEHSRGDHANILQVMLEPPPCNPLQGMPDEMIDFTDVDIRLPMLVYVSREKRPGYDHNKKAGAMNALVRASAVLSNGPFILNLDCDHYIYNTQAIREGMCFMMDRDGGSICYIQFPQRFEGIDPSDRYANHNTVFFDGNMRALDGVQGPMYVGTGCIFRRFALYGFDPPMEIRSMDAHSDSEIEALKAEKFYSELDSSLLPKRFGNSGALVESIPIAEFQGRPIADHPGVKHGRPPGALRAPRLPIDPTTLAEAVSVISCWYEDKTEWGDRVGWISGSVTEDVVTGYRMHNRGWHSIYCITKRDAFRGSAPINLTDRLHQVLRWATGSVEIFFSRNNALIASSKMKFLQRIAYLNVGIYLFTSIFLLVYCFLPALSLFSGQFIVQTLNVTFLVYLLTITITITLILLAILEVKWSGVGLEEWWRNEQFWLISGTSAHLYAVIQGLLKVIAGVEISFTLTSKSAASEDDDADTFADLYVVKWTSLMVPPITIMMVNLIAVAVGFARTIYSTVPQWSKLMGGGFFSFWVLVHLYPFAKGLMGRRGKTPTIVFVWSGLIAISISLLWVAINPPSGSKGTAISNALFQLPRFI